MYTCTNIIQQPFFKHIVAFTIQLHVLSNKIEFTTNLAPATSHSFGVSCAKLKSPSRKHYLSKNLIEKIIITVLLIDLMVLLSLWFCSFSIRIHCILLCNVCKFFKIIYSVSLILNNYSLKLMSCLIYENMTWKS